MLAPGMGMGRSLGAMSNQCLCYPQKISSLESPKPQASDVVRADAQALSESSTWGHRQLHPEPQEDSERHQDSERLRGALRSLRGERKALQAQLQEREYVSGAAAPAAAVRFNIGDSQLVPAA